MQKSENSFLNEFFKSITPEKDFDKDSHQNLITLINFFGHVPLKINLLRAYPLLIKNLKEIK